jgi:shikimate kinase
VSVERVVVWGFMASGKSAVAAGLAERLGWEHLDLDAEIVRHAGCSIAELFRTAGEAAFRELEAEVTRTTLDRTRTVFSPGGGWITNPAHAAGLPEGTLTVWLQASPEVVLARVRADRSGIERPLLSTPDPAAAIRRLLAEREPLYRRADLAVDTDPCSLVEVVDRVHREVLSRTAPRKLPPS